MTGWTIDDVLALRPCSHYRDRDVLTGLWGGRERLTPRDVAALDIPAEDRIWLLVRGDPAWVHPAIERIVARAVSNHALQCGVPDVERWAAAWFDGDRSPAAAETAAWAAAWAAARAGERDRQIDDLVQAWEEWSDAASE